MTQSTQSADQPRFSPGVGLFIGVLAVSTASLFIRFAQREAPSLVVAAMRMTLAVLLMAPFCWRALRRDLPGLTRKEVGLLVLAGLFLGAHFATWITSLQYTSVASSVVLVTTSPLWVALLSPLALKEHLSGKMKIGLAVAMTGGMVVGLGDACHWSAGLVCQPFSVFVQGQAFFGNILALVGAWCAAGYLLIGRRVRPRLSLSSYTFSVYGVTTVVLLLLVAAFRLPLTGYSPVTYGWFLALALVPQLLGHTLYNWALRYLPAAYVSLGILGEPIGTVMLAYLFLREAPTLLEVAGGGMILGGIALATRLSKASDVPVDALE